MQERAKHVAKAGHAGNAARMEAANEHKAMMQQQAAVHNQATHHNAVNGVHHHAAGINSNQHHNTSTGPMVSSLHSIVGRLNQADHDYDGHRVQAIHQLGQAIHTLQPGTAHANGTAGLAGNNGKGIGNGTAPATANRMPQAESDGHLRQAHQELAALEGRMAGVTGNARTPHHQQAHTHVQQALQHLNTALATR